MTTGISGPARVRLPAGVDPIRVGAWRLKAACLDHPDPDLWFPAGNTGPALPQIEAAKAVCGPCRVRQECLGYALDTGQQSGVWGGLSETELVAERRRGQRQRQRERAQ